MAPCLSGVRPFFPGKHTLTLLAFFISWLLLILFQLVSVFEQQDFNFVHQHSTSVLTYVELYFQSTVLPRLLWCLAYCCLSIAQWHDDLLDPVCTHVANILYQTPLRTNPHRPRPTRRAPWKSSIGYPASWLILSATLFTMSTASTLQVSQSSFCGFTSKSVSVRATRSPNTSDRTRRPLKLWEQPIYDWEWDSLPRLDDVPAKYLHLSGFGPEFEQLLTLKYQAYWAAEDTAASPISTVFDPNVILRCPLFQPEPRVFAPTCLQAG
jgi:hypothetical protein